MIVKLRGILSDCDEESIVLERDGLAYEVLVPTCTMAELVAMRGQEIALHTMEYLEGNAASGGNLTPRMIGFLHPEDRAFFRQFLTVKGVGVRKALRALAAPVAKIAADIESGDARALSGLPGIGKRMAEQIIAELRGKVGAHALAGAASAAQVVKSSFTPDQRDAIEIVVAWGDSRSDAERWIARAAQLHQDLGSPEAWVKAAYKIKNRTET
jgi:holliday junction DNA helicase RuvA